ncbi:MAG: transposase [Phycisphaerae bacterium]
MARLARVVFPELPHHITQRGNRRQQTFFGDDDYRQYLDLMRQWCTQHQVQIWAYCLMPNHVHLILVPPSEEALARAVGEAHRRYTRHVNFREGWRGHLWQGRFASFVMDEAYLLAATRYVERNPVRAHLVDEAADWPWSSAAAHTGRVAGGLAAGEWLHELTAGWVCSWQEYLRDDQDEQPLAQALHRSENTGRPLGPVAFVKKLEAALGRPLLPNPGGRPPKPKKAKRKRRN